MEPYHTTAEGLGLSWYEFEVLLLDFLLFLLLQDLILLSFLISCCLLVLNVKIEHF